MSLGVRARCITLQEVTEIQILEATAALIQESVKGDSLVETNEEVIVRSPKELVL